MVYSTISKRSITQRRPPPLNPFSCCFQGILVFGRAFLLHKLAYGKIRLAVQNLTMVLQSENETEKFVYFKYKCVSCLFILEAHIHYARVQCSLERWIITSFSMLVPNFPFANPSISIQALLPCKSCVTYKRRYKNSIQYTKNTFFSSLYSNLMISVIFSISLVYPLYFSMLTHRKEIKGESQGPCVRLEIYIHIKFNLIPIVSYFSQNYD